CAIYYGNYDAMDYW
nr:immunoglobulin heavy chain junction region [Mus musculus]MBK4188975.1 immunoglobulin heavy chain junction region [Mus musculus]